MSDITQLSDQQLKQALGYNSSSDITKLSDDELQKSLNPGYSPQMPSTPTPGMDFGTMAWDTMARAGMGAYDATKWIPGVKQLSNITPGQLNSGDSSADAMSQNLYDNANPGQKVIQGTGRGLATIPQVIPFVKAAGAIPVLGKFAGGALNPIMGMAGYGGTTAAMQGQNPVQGAAEGAGQGLAYSAGGAAGSALAKMALNPIARAVGGGIGQTLAKSATTIGNVAGSAGAGALTSPQDPVASGIVGGALGAINPMGEESYADTLQKAADQHAGLLNLGKGTIKKVEGPQSGKDLNDSYQLAASNGLIYNKSQEGRLDTKQAQAQIQPNMDILHNQANAIVQSDPNKQFDLQQLGDQAKADLRKNPLFQNDLAYNAAKDQIDSHVQAAIQNRGQFVDAHTLNNIKQGMWKASFEPLQPNNNAVARQLGNTAKGALEQAFPNSGLAQTNAQLGKYLDLNSVLINADGNALPKQKSIPFLKTGTTLAGGLAGHLVPGGEVGGMIGGGMAGLEAGKHIQAHLNNIYNDPAFITKGIADKVKMSQFKNGVNITPKFNHITPAPAQPSQGLGQFNPIQSANPQGTILGPNGQPLNPMANKVSPQGLPQGVKALGMAAGIGLGSMFNPLNNAQAAQVKEPERLQLPGDQYTKKEEGFQANPYIDTTGNKTIGYGFNMKVVGNMLPSLVQEGKRPLTRPEADNIYNKLYSKAMSNAQDFAGDSWHSMNGQQQKALSDMSYNMGGKLNGFKKMQAAIQDGDFKTAASEIMNSNYAKEAKNRAMRNATLIQG